MAPGDATVQIIDANATAIKNAIEGVRVTANDKWLLTGMANGQQVILAHIEEA